MGTPFLEFLKEDLILEIYEKNQYRCMCTLWHVDYATECLIADSQDEFARLYQDGCGEESADVGGQSFCRACQSIARNGLGHR